MTAAALFTAALRREPMANPDDLLNRNSGRLSGRPMIFPMYNCLR